MILISVPDTARQSIELQIERDTGADLDRSDLEFQEDDGQITGELTASGEEQVAVAQSPFSGVPVVGGITTTGSRIRTRYRQATEPAADWWEENTPSKSDVYGALGAAAPVAAAEPTPIGEVSLGTAAAAGGVVFGTAAVAGHARGDAPDQTATEQSPSRETLEQAATAELGEIPAPTQPASEPFPGDAPAPTREIGEIFPTGSAPADTTDPFAPETPAPERPTEPFGPEQSPPTEAPEGVAPESPPIDPDVGESIGGPAGFAGQQGIVRQRPGEAEPDDPRTITEDDIFAGGMPMPGEPGYPGSRTVEGQRVRTWPGEQPVGTSENVWNRSQEDLFPGQEVFTGQGISPLSDSIVGPDVASRTDSLSMQDQAQAQRGMQAQRGAQLQQPQQAEVPDYATPEVQGPGYPNPPRYGYPAEPGFPQRPGYPAPPESPPRRRPRLPDRPGAQDRDREDPLFEDLIEPLYADFRNPLTGDVIETERAGESVDGGTAAENVGALLGGPSGGGGGTGDDPHGGGSQSPNGGGVGGDPTDQRSGEQETTGTPIATGIETGTTHTDLAGTRFVSRPDEVATQARDFEQQVVEQTGADPGDVSIALVERDGDTVFRPRYTDEYRRERVAERTTAAMRENPFGSGGQSPQPQTERVQPSDITLTNGEPRLTDDFLREQAAADIEGVGPSGVEIVDGEPQLTPSARETVERQAEQQATEQLRADLSDLFSGADQEDIETTVGDGSVRAQLSDEFITEKQESAIASARWLRDRRSGNALLQHCDIFL